MRPKLPPNEIEQSIGEGNGTGVDADATGPTLAWDGEVATNTPSKTSAAMSAFFTL